jgi:hypothetical protein
MTKRSVILGWCPLVAVACLLVCKAAGGQAEEPERKFTSMVLTGSLEQVSQAISKAFGNGAYHRKHLFAPPYDYVIQGQERISVPLTNAWDLAVPDGGWLPLTLIPAGRNMVAYDENFFIKAEAVSGGTRVSIRSGASGTTERTYALSMHLKRILGGRYHPPLPSETTNLFLRIQRQLEELKVGRTDALPPTPDTAPGYYLQFWTTMGVEEQHDSRNWDRMVQAWRELQEGHNPQGGANVRQPSSSVTNQTPAAAAPRRSP